MHATILCNELQLSVFRWYKFDAGNSLENCAVSALFWFFFLSCVDYSWKYFCLVESFETPLIFLSHSKYNGLRSIEFSFGWVHSKLIGLPQTLSNALSFGRVSRNKPAWVESVAIKLAYNKYNRSHYIFNQFGQNIAKLGRVGQNIAIFKRTGWNITIWCLFYWKRSPTTQLGLHKSTMLSFVVFLFYFVADQVEIFERWFDRNSPMMSECRYSSGLFC